MVSVLNKMELRVLLLFFILAFLLRFFTFFPIIIDHDESTYLVIGNELTKGKILYHDVTDIKPVGIFYIVAGFIETFGRTIFGFRAFGTFIIALTSFFLFWAKRNLGYERNVSLAAGIIYIFFISTWSQYGASINTEHFYNLFTALALFILFSTKDRYSKYWFSLIFGIGFLIKIVVLFDFAAIILFLIATDYVKKVSILKILQNYFVCGILFILPFVIVNLLFWLTGYYNDFFNVNFVVFGKYPVDRSLVKMILWIVDFLLRFLPISAFLVLSMISASKPKGVRINERQLVLIWIFFCVISVTLPGKRLGHYLIQIMIPISFYAANVFDKNVKRPAFLTKIFQPKIGITLLSVISVLVSLLHWNDYNRKKEYPGIITAEILPELHPEDIVYTGNTEQITYFLLNTSPPTKYIHKTLMTNPVHINALGFNVGNELMRIYSKKPRFVLERFSSERTIIPKLFQQDYCVRKYYPEYDLTIYELIVE